MYVTSFETYLKTFLQVYSFDSLVNICKYLDNPNHMTNQV